MARGAARGRERGSVLFFAVLVLAILSVLVASFLSETGLLMAVGVGHRDRDRARALAHSGLERAIYELSRDSTWSGTGGAEVPFGPGAGYAVVVTASSTEVVIVATGRFDERTAEVRAAGILRPFHGTVALACVGGPFAIEEGSGVFDLEGDFHLDDPSGPGMALQGSVSVAITGDVLDVQERALPASIVGLYRPRRQRRPLPAVDLALLESLATTVLVGGGIPAELNGALTGLIYVKADRDVKLRDVTITGTLVIEPDAAGLYKLDLNDDVVIDATDPTKTPTPGLALCVPGMAIESYGRTRLVVDGIIVAGDMAIRGDPANNERVGGTRIRGRILADVPIGGRVAIRPQSTKELTAGAHLDVLPVGLTPSSWRFFVTEVAER